MTSDNFAYWLQGFFELTGTNQLSEKQVRMIKEHLQLVFNKVTPDHNETENEPENAHVTFKGKVLSELSDEELVDAIKQVSEQSTATKLSDKLWALMFALAEEQHTRKKIVAALNLEQPTSPSYSEPIICSCNRRFC